jgi:hypothetical protein
MSWAPSPPATSAARLPGYSPTDRPRRPLTMSATAHHGYIDLRAGDLRDAGSFALDLRSGARVTPPANRRMNSRSTGARRQLPPQGTGAVVADDRFNHRP